HNDPVTQIEYTDSPDADGFYTFSVASIRKENNQTSLSAQSTPVKIKSDATTPLAPLDFKIDLASNGVHAQWTSPGYQDKITYAVYRTNAQTITSLQGLTPIIPKIPKQYTSVVDPNPSPTEHCYAVAAIDEAGNISPPSNSAYLNFKLLPMATLKVIKNNDEFPIVSWTHAGGLAGADIYLVKDPALLKLNSALLVARTYKDTGYTGEQRTYSIIAKDEHGEESLARTIILPKIKTELLVIDGAAQEIKRGIMNKLEYKVKNNSSYEVKGIQLKADIGTRKHISDKFSLAQNEEKIIDVIVGGYADLPDLVEVTTTTKIEQELNKSVEISTTSELTVGMDMLDLTLRTEEFTRGATGIIHFELKNTCA
ncbi:MAG: hypothetical protein KAR45_16480, partial [Desulfobacteraceae bacterium]|nr:hypothetical protein [Desulfobacteraceae bacterium]